MDSYLVEYSSDSWFSQEGNFQICTRKKYHLLNKYLFTVQIEKIVLWWGLSKNMIHCFLSLSLSCYRMISFHLFWVVILRRRFHLVEWVSKNYDNALWTQCKHYTVKHRAEHASCQKPYSDNMRSQSYKNNFVLIKTKKVVNSQLVF